MNLLDSDYNYRLHRWLGICKGGGGGGGSEKSMILYSKIDVWDSIDRLKDNPKIGMRILQTVVHCNCVHHTLRCRIIVYVLIIF